MKVISLNVRGFGSSKGIDKFGWVKNIIRKEKPHFVAIQESRLNLIDRKWVSSLCGFSEFDFIQQEKVGNSGGQLLIWDSNYFEAISIIRFDHVLGVCGTWKYSGCKLNVINVYGPHDDQNKQKLWDCLSKLLEHHDVDNDVAWLLCGDFNEVREQGERFNCEFLEYRAKRFNDFINNSCLIEIPLGGRSFTRVSDDGLKFSKLDRFLVSGKFCIEWGNLMAIALEREHSDHCPIVLKDEDINFGPKPFKMFDAWLDEKDIDEVIIDAWKEDVKITSRKDCVFRNKLKNVK
ncbi:uncharacterized protein [Rutidosis leptorrhynchoides]|uniref:uncharacterized protein n=1 Tax=Rutidosis leptorrhynchoides TaxID=125765 RepID=UPI003A99ACBC